MRKKYGTISGVYKIQSRIKPNRLYVGSAVSIPERWSDHLRLLDKGCHHSIKLQNHYNKYGKNDLVFSIIVGCDKGDLIVTEQFYIDAYNPWFNIAPNAGSLLGYKHTAQAINNMVNARKGYQHSDETKRKISESHKGFRHSKETKQKMKTIAKKRMTAEVKEKLRISHINRKASDSTRRKMSESRKGRPAHNKGAIHTSKTRELISQKVRAYYERKKNKEAI